MEKILYLNKFFDLLIPVNGSWSDWQELDTCSVSCGNGTRTYQRLCNNPALQNGGLQCPGTHMKVEDCTNPACPGKLTNISLFCKFYCRVH